VNPKLWWPAGYGEAYLYDFRVDAWTESFNSSLCHKGGIRHVELVQDDTTAGNVTGKTFYFKVNHVPVFVKGANWIPTDSFPTRAKSSAVRHLLASVRAANMNMVRKRVDSEPSRLLELTLLCCTTDPRLGRWPIRIRPVLFRMRSAGHPSVAGAHVCLRNVSS